MKPRWKIKFKYGDGNTDEVKLYYTTKDEAYNSWCKNFEIISIEQDTDTSYLDYIKQVKNKSELVGKNSNKEVYKFPKNGSYILVSFHLDDEEYYDYCTYQRRDCRGWMNPVTWIVSNPKDFCSMFDTDNVEQLPQGYVVTPKEIKKLKAKKFYNKNGEVLWVDSQGYIYHAEKFDMPNKHNKAEYERFKNNSNAVLVEYVL